MTFSLQDVSRAGVLNVRNWQLVPNGDQTRALWCRKWLLRTDKQLDLAGIKTSDRWAMLAMSGEKILAIIPGCEVCGYYACESPPPINAYILGD